jgi:hypothetical protein
MLSKFEIVTLSVAMGISLLLGSYSARQLSSTILMSGAGDNYAQYSSNGAWIPSPSCVNSNTGLRNPTMSLHGEPQN